MVIYVYMYMCTMKNQPYAFYSTDAFPSEDQSSLQRKSASEMDFQYKPCESTPSCAPNQSSSSTPYADNEVGTVVLFGVPIVCLYVENKERLCLAQISNTLLRNFSYNEIHNRRVALGITCLQCTPVQLEILRRTGAMPVSSRRCGLITKREAERLVKSFLEEIPPPKLPENFSFKVNHTCGWGCQGLFLPSRYNSSRAKCIKCSFCNSFFSPNKFIFHYHKTPSASYRHPDAANFNSWRRHLNLNEPSPSDSLQHAWEDVKSMFNGGCRKRSAQHSFSSTTSSGAPPIPVGPLNQNPFDHLQAVPTGMNQYNRYMGPAVMETDTPDRSVAHASFPSGYSSNVIGPYGDILRSLSMHYNPWWKSMYLAGQPYPHCNSVSLPINMPCINYSPMLLSTNDSSPLSVDSSQSPMDKDIKLAGNSTQTKDITSEEKKLERDKSPVVTQPCVISDGSQFLGVDKSSLNGSDGSNINEKSKIQLECNVKDEQTKPEPSRRPNFSSCDETKKPFTVDDMDISTYSIDQLRELLLKSRTGKFGNPS